MHNHSYENEFNLHVNEISFSYEKMSIKTRLEDEAKGNSEMAYCMLLYMNAQLPTSQPFVQIILIRFLLAVQDVKNRG